VNRGVRIIFDVTIGLGIAAATLALLLIPQAATPPWYLVLGLAAAAAIGEFATIAGDDEEGEHSFSFATTAHLAAAMLLLPGWAAPNAAVGSVVGELLRRARPLSIALNGSLAMFCTLIASAVFHGVQGEAGLGPRTYLAVALMLAVFIPLNLAPPGLATTIVSQQTLRPLAWLPPADLLTYVMEACLAAALALVVTTAPSFLFFLLPLLVAVFLSVQRARLLTRETRHTLRALVSIIDAKDPTTAAHSERVGDMSARLAESLGFAEREVREIRWAGRMHDIGKVGVEDSVLQKPNALTESEWEAMRRHPALGADLLEPLRLTRALAPAVRYHHERADGRGYYMLPSDEVPLQASILAIVDAFDAMTSDRPYRDALSFDDALGRIEADAGTHFNPELATAFVAMMRGQRVPQLSMQEQGVRAQLKGRLHEVRRGRGRVAADGSAEAPA
jgi:HD-GYP domain-containing protein (c-di-GMP phosphodiesterase class II)